MPASSPGVPSISRRRRPIRRTPTTSGTSNFTVRGYAERNAINMPIQGTAADMIKLAMIRVHRALQRENMQTKMILQVHDELIFDTPREEAEQVKLLIREGMEGAMPLPHDVPVLAEAGSGENWLEAH